MGRKIYNFRKISMMALDSADVPTSPGGSAGTDLPTVDEDEELRRP